MRFQASLSSVVDTILDYERRQKWDPNMQGFRVLHSTPCLSYRRLYYYFKAWTPVTDRDFHLKEYYRKDWPREGMHALFVQSLPLGYQPGKSMNGESLEEEKEVEMPA